MMLLINLLIKDTRKAEDNLVNVWFYIFYYIFNTLFRL